MSIQTKKATQIMRVSTQCYTRLDEMRTRYAEHIGAKRVTYGQLLNELASLADLLLDGREVYFTDGKLLQDPADAWGHAIQASVRTHSEITPPLVLLEVGPDDRFSGARK